MTKIQQTRVSLALKFDKWFSRILYLLGALVVYAAQDPTWAALLGKWGGIATVAIGFAASEIRKAKEKANGLAAGSPEVG